MIITSHLILFILQWFFAVIGILGNSWVIVAILRYNAIKRTSNKILFINLAVADMGVLIIRNPFYFLLIFSHNRWLFGEIACKVLLPFSLMFMPASFLTLVVIWYSRCSAIVNIRQLTEISVRTAWYTVIAIWTFVAIFYPIIEIPVRNVNTTAQTCDLDVSRPVSYTLYALEDLYFVAAFLVIIVMFIRMRRSLLRFSNVYNNDVIVKRCTCGNCREIAGCLVEMQDELVVKELGKQPNCITDHPGFNAACLNRWSLILSARQYETRGGVKYRKGALEERLMKNMKALKMLWPIVIVLFLCMLPLAIGRTWQWITGDENEISLYFLHIIDVLLVTNSACNPYLYIIVSTEFRQKFWQIPCVKFLQVRFSKGRSAKSGSEKNDKCALYPNVGESNV